MQLVVRRIAVRSAVTTPPETGRTNASNPLLHRPLPRRGHRSRGPRPGPRQPRQGDPSRIGACSMAEHHHCPAPGPHSLTRPLQLAMTKTPIVLAGLGTQDRPVRVSSPPVSAPLKRSRLYDHIELEAVRLPGCTRR